MSALLKLCVVSEMFACCSKTAVTPMLSPRVKLDAPQLLNTECENVEHSPSVDVHLSKGKVSSVVKNLFPFWKECCFSLRGENFCFNAQIFLEDQFFPQSNNVSVIKGLVIDPPCDWGLYHCWGASPATMHALVGTSKLLYSHWPLDYCLFWFLHFCRQRK